MEHAESVTAAAGNPPTSTRYPACQTVRNWRINEKCDPGMIPLDRHRVRKRTVIERP
jgi:hypothetical protein